MQTGNWATAHLPAPAFRASFESCRKCAHQRSGLNCRRKRSHLRGDWLRRSSLLGRQLPRSTRRWLLDRVQHPGSGLRAIKRRGRDFHGFRLHMRRYDCRRRQCWGDGSSGQLGNGNGTNSATPAQVSGLSSGVSAIASGDSRACALTNAGGVWCWGSNAHGELGNGTMNTARVPVQVLDFTGNAPSAMKSQLPRDKTTHAS